MLIHSVVYPHHIDADQDSDFLFHADPDADPDRFFTLGADPDPDPRFKQKAHTLEKVLK
jgi:hypothetical protein